MKTAPIIATFFILTVLISASPLLGDSERVADITDSSGTVTHVSGLHYCYEEMEGDDLYVNKFDEFFVQRGEAIIRVLFEDLASVKFKGKIEEKEGKRIRKALIVTRSGKEVEAYIQCHDQCFIKGNVDLGEFRLDLSKVEKLDFLKGAEAADIGLQVLAAGEAPPAGIICLSLQSDGTIIMNGLPNNDKPVPIELEALVPTIKNNTDILSAFKHGVFLTTQENVPCSKLLDTLKKIRKAGVRHILIGS
ncbi:MAG: hypothetical protein ABIK28_23575 [Planctomycetota bacterium]